MLGENRAMSGSRPASQSPDPSAVVEAPIRGALDAIVVRGTVAFALAVGVVIGSFNPDFHPFAHVALPLAVAAYLAIRLVIRLTRPGVDPSGAWRTAQTVAPGAARLAKLVAVAVPFGAALAAWSLALHHIDAPDRPVLVGFVAPMYVLLWLAASGAWLDECRDRLARAELESRDRFRMYWARIPIGRA